MLLARRSTVALRRLGRNRNTSLTRRLSLIAVDRAGGGRIRLLTIGLRSAAAARSSRDDNRSLGGQRDGRIPDSVRVDVAVVSPQAGDGHGHGGGRQELRLVVVPDCHLLFGQIPERRLVQHDGVVQAAKVGLRGHLLVARVAFALWEGSHGLVGVHAEVVEVGKVEAVVLEQGAEAADRCHLVGVDGDDRVVDGGAATVDAAQVSERDCDGRGCDGDSFGDERVGRTGG